MKISHEIHRREIREGFKNCWCKRIAKGTNKSGNDLKDLSTPTLYIKYINATLNNIRSNKWKYTDKAFNTEKQIIMKLAQKVLQEMSDQDKERHDILAFYGLI